ncbi:hypothetical protein CYY_003112 [Polysphondylium violaceum]|uniref:RNase III domain-containing protein n=1 Tax=Polysphondylium violaceum TaxID=133409 RepID=A0A8J4V901_9MYCE|nr:hypothetical protein CYY_003112 [Polysphondylium violaceum]
MTKKINFTEPIQTLIAGSEIGACFEPVTQKDLFQNLEFFGDAVLHYQISKLIFKTKNYLDPNHNTSLRTFAEKNATLNDFFDKFELQAFLSKSNYSYLASNQLKGKADIVEALIGELDRSKSIVAKNLLAGIVGFLLSIGENLFNQEHPHILDFGSLSRVAPRLSSTSPTFSSNISALSNNSSSNRQDVDKRKITTPSKGKEVKTKVSYVNNKINHGLPVVESKRSKSQQDNLSKAAAITPSRVPSQETKKDNVVVLKTTVPQQQQQQQKVPQMDIIQDGHFFKPVMVQQQQTVVNYQYAILTPMFLEKRLVPSASEPRLNF